MYEDLVKYGYTPEIKNKSVIILLYIWLHHQNHMYDSGDFYPFFPSHFWLLLKTSKITKFFNFLISHFGEISPVKYLKSSVQECFSTGEKSPERGKKKLIKRAKKKK
jgi:hypothetical protein